MLEQIELAKIVVEKHRDVVDLKGLAESIEQVGLLHPLLVQPQGDGYTLVAGYRRFLAIKQLGWKTAPAFILPPDAPADLIRIIENIQREDVDPLCKAEALLTLKRDKGWSHQQLSEVTGMPQSKVSYYLNILDLPAKYQREIVKNFQDGSSPLTLSHVAVARVVERTLGNPEMFYLILDAVLEYGLTKAETQEIVSLIKKNYNLSLEAALILVRPAQFRYEQKITRLSKPVEELLQAYEALGKSLESLKDAPLATGSRKELLNTVRRVLDQVETTRNILERS
ncbi:MAG TPA: ParB/RepB/Spo0J family partition protein [Firmicutes bacterium]|nr:ParB/RepB/Spo0J family partition protein [Bacillota bacterium]